MNRDNAELGLVFFVIGLLSVLNMLIYTGTLQKQARIYCFQKNFDHRTPLLQPYPHFSNVSRDLYEIEHILRNNGPNNI